MPNKDQTTQGLNHSKDVKSSEAKEGERGLRYFSTFSGIGGFEEAITQAYEQRIGNPGYRKEESTAKRKGVEMERVLHSRHTELKEPNCVGFSEIDKYASQVYQKHFPNHKAYGDITKINPKELPDFDLLVGGFPCQSFSIAGKRRGFNDTRGTLFFEIARIIKQKQPRLLLLENVKGLLSHDKGNTFATIISTLDELGYDCQWQVLNSKNYGVPQNRERVFIIGHLGGEPRRKVFPIGENDKVSNEPERGNEPETEHIFSTVATKADRKEGNFTAKPILMPSRKESRQNGRRVKTHNEDMFTLTAMDVHGIVGDTRIRRLTPLECERLQGFPDNWTEGISDTQRYKCCGNAVTVNVVREIIKKLIT